MWSFLSDLAQKPNATYTVILMEADGVDQTRQHALQPRRLAALWGGTLLGTAVLVTLMIAFTPLRTLIPGYGTEEVQRSARLSALRVAALQDSIEMQRRYIERVQDLMTGRVDEATPEAESVDPPADPAPSPSQEDEAAAAAASEDWEDHQQPAFAPSSFPAGRTQVVAASGSGALPSLPLPLAPPVEDGFPTRGFDARAGHYAVDIAVSEGAYVHAVGDGYVVVSDWTQDGGYSIAVQHADGYLSVYKHNKRLLKRVGDRVRVREAIAVSGNTGEVTTGPHVHFELWHNGLAQDPRPYVAGW